MAAPVVEQLKLEAQDVASDTHTLAFDTAPTNGNWVFIFVHYRGTVDETEINVTTPASGVTAIANGVASAIGKCWRFQVTASQENSYVVTNSTVSDADAGSVMAIVEVSGVNDSDPVNGSAVDSSGNELTSLTVGNVITDVDDCLMICFIGVRAGGDDNSFSFDNSYTVQADDESTSGTQPSGGGIATKTLSGTATESTTGSWTDSGRCVGLLIAIEPDAGTAITEGEIMAARQIGGTQPVMISTGVIAY